MAKGISIRSIKMMMTEKLVTGYTLYIEYARMNVYLGND